MKTITEAKEIISNIIRSDRVSDTLELTYEVCLDLGADKFSYHFAPLLERVASPYSKIFAWGYPHKWVALYDRREVRAADPVPDAVIRSGRMMTWSEVANSDDFDESERAYLDMARSYGLLNGWGIPLWGPKAQNAYAAVGFPTAAMPARSEMAWLRMVLQAAHERVCECVNQIKDGPSLSEREIEVLAWVAKGKSNSDIAAILSISPDTVATYVRRIFTKLNSHDRIGATIKALKLGLINI